MGMEGILPTMPQFREPNGRIDWRQVWDVFIPGNAYDSRTNQWRPQGIAAGVVDQFVPFGGLAVEAVYANRDRFRMPNMPNFRNPFTGIGDWLGGRTGRSGGIGEFARYGRGVTSNPERFSSDAQRISDAAMAHEPGSRNPQQQQQAPQQGRTPIVGWTRRPSRATEMFTGRLSGFNERAQEFMDSMHPTQEF